MRRAGNMGNVYFLHPEAPSCPDCLCFRSNLVLFQKTCPVYDICAALPFNLGLTGTRIPVKVQDYRENQGNSRQAIY